MIRTLNEEALINVIWGATLLGGGGGGSCWKHIKRRIRKKRRNWN